MAKKKKKERKKSRERVEDFLKKRKHILNILGLERELCLPIGTIQKFLNNDRRISSERILKIDKAILNYFIDYEEY